MTAPTETGLVITLAQIYAEVQSMSKTVGRVDTTLTEFRTETGRVLADHETRIRADEASRWPLPGIVAVATVVGAVAAGLALFITR